VAGDQTSLSLLQRVADRNQEAWARLVVLYSPLVSYWCRKGGLAGEDISDVLQDVFQALLTSLPQYRSQQSGTFRAWLRGITRHKILDHFKRLNRQPQAEGGSEAYQRIQETPDQLADWDDTDPEQEVKALYQRALELVRSEFEPRSWQAFHRTVVEDQAVALVAAELGMTTVAVRKAKSRVLRRLREEVGDLIA
jgi:RNA polymerase sigma-70 factor, ECF subfamily